MFLKSSYKHKMWYGDFCMKKYLEKYVGENAKVIKITSLAIIVGILIGIFIFQIFNVELKQEFVNSIKETLDIAKSGNFENINIIKNGILSNLLLVTLIYLAAITLIAPICIIGINFFKGFSIGLYITTLFYIFGFGKGILVTFLIVILPNVIYLPTFVYLSTNAINFYYMIIEKNNKLSLIVKESYRIIISISLIILSVLIEQLLSFAVINLYIK